MSKNSNTLNAKICLRKDTVGNWNNIKSRNTVLLDGEVAIVIDPLDQTYNFKIGDGITPFYELDFIKYKNITIGNSIDNDVYSLVNGLNDKSEGEYSHSEGINTITKKPGSHSEGLGWVFPDGESTLDEEYGCSAGFVSHTEGLFCNTEGFGSHTSGVNADDDGYAGTYVWQGYHGQPLTNQQLYSILSNLDTATQYFEQIIEDNPRYKSHGHGTFNVNPVGGSNGFYIGDSTLKTLLDNISNNIPSKTSDLTNDGDGTNPFLTQHQSLQNYALKSDLPYSLASVTSSTESWILYGNGYNPSHTYHFNIYYNEDDGMYYADIYDENDEIGDSAVVESEDNVVSFPYLNISAIKGESYQLLDHSISTISGLYYSEWIWNGGESGEPYYDSNEQCWYVNNPSWGGYTSPYYDSSEATYLYFYEESYEDVELTLTSISDQGDESSYYYTFEDSNGNTYNSYGYPGTWEAYRDSDSKYFSLNEEVTNSTEIGTTFWASNYDYITHECVLSTNYVKAIKLNIPQQISNNKARDFIVKIDLTPFNSSNIPIISFDGKLSNSLPTFTNRLYLLKFKETNENEFRCIDISSDVDINQLKTNVSSLQSNVQTINGSIQTINDTIGNLESIINGI